MALRRMGHDITFVVDSAYRLHRPEFRYAEIARPYPAWIRNFAGVPDKYWKYLLPNRSVRDIREAVRDCDAVIASGLWPVIARRLGKPYIAMLAGSDLEVYADPHAMLHSQSGHLAASPAWSRWLKRLTYLFISHRQRAAIRDASAFIAVIPGLIPNATRLLQEIGPKGRHLFGLMTDLHDITYAVPPDNRPLRILNAARLTWKKPLRPGTCELDYKGTDILLEGFALYRRQAAVPMRLTLVRKGLDIGATQALVAQLGLDADVDWLDEMSQSDLLKAYRHADIIADQMAQSIVSGAGLDAMAVGRPLLANGRPEVMEAFLGEPSPICQASTPEQVCAQLLLLSDVGYREQVGRRSRVYVEKHFAVERVAERCLQALDLRG